MRPAIYVAAALALAAAAPDVLRSALASAASVLLESLPYLAAGAAASRIAGRYGRGLAAFLGCGCSDAPAARSIPAAVAAAALFGPAVAAARFAAAVAVAHLIRGRRRPSCEPASIGTTFVSLVPAALLCGALASLAPLIHLRGQPALLAGAVGLLLGFAAAPCALGGVALAASLHAQSPIASAVVLCVSGILDMSVWTGAHRHRIADDGIACLCIAAVCALIAYQHGAALVHPRVALALWGAALMLVVHGLRHRSHRSLRTRWIAIAFGVVCVIGSPPPPLIADEASFDGGYAGERISFTGRYDRSRVVRYAITCCRADARPVALTLDTASKFAEGTWIRADGTLEANGAELVLKPAHIEAVTPPADPFIYR